MNTKTDLKLSLALEEILYDNASKIHSVMYEEATRTLFIDGFGLDVHLDSTQSPYVKRTELEHVLNQL